MRPADKPKRGRKSKPEEKYISDSLRTIDEMEKRLLDEKTTLSSSERDQLRN